MFRNIPEHFLVVTLNHRTVSIDQLYQFSIPEEWMQDLLLAFQSAPSIKEVAGLCTCNRTEFYAAVHSVKDAAHAIVHILSERLGVSLESMRQGMDVIVDAEAVEHLFRLAAGLESMVVGDAQILGQVKAAYQFSESLNLAGKIFHHLFPKAFSMAKRVRHQTGLGKGRVSVSALAVECARQFFVSTDTLVATVVGAGKMGRLSAKYLCDAGCKEIRIVNRSVDKSLQLAQEVGGIAYNFDEMATALAGSQLVISSTAAKSPIITKRMVEEVGQVNPLPRLFIDIALPADIEASVGELENVTWMDLEGLRRLANENQEQRQAEIACAEAIVFEELKKLGPWPLPFHIDRFASHLGTMANQVCKAEVEALFKKLPELGPEQKAIIQAGMERLAEKMILAPRRNARTRTSVRTCPNATRCLADLFAMDCGTRSEFAEDPVAGVHH